MPTRQRIMVIGCGFPQLGLIRACKAAGLHVIGVDFNPRAVGVAYADEFLEVSTNDAEGITAAARSARVDGITTAGSEGALRPTAVAAETLGLPFYAQPAQLGVCQHKDLQRRAFADAGAPSPAFAIARGLAEAKAFVSAQGLPVVVKPSRGWGQRGVRVVKLETELEQAVIDALAAAAENLGDDATCLVEGFIEGREFSVNAYTMDGETEVFSVTERIVTSYPDPPGITHAEVYGSNLPPEAERQVVDAAIAGAKALGITRGPTYTQLRAGPAGAFLVETAYRLGGGLDPDVALLASGKSLYRRLLGVALGRPEWERSGPEAPAFGGAIGRFLIGVPGVIRSVSGLEDARALPGVVDAQVYLPEGGTVLPLTDGAKRAGHVLCTGDSRADAEATADKARSLISINTERAES